MTRSHRSFVSYIDKSRDFYAAQGYDAPYRWAANDDAPFTALAKPLAQSRVGVVTTSSLEEGKGKELFFAPTSPTPAAMVTEHLSWHKKATHTNDLGSFLPIDHLRTLEAEGLIGSIGPRFAGTPTVYSQRRTEKNAHTIAEAFAEDEVDLAVLIPL